MDCWVSVLRLFKYWHFELVPTQITSTRQPGDGTQQSAFLHSVASKVVRFAIVCRFQAIGVSVWLCSFHRKNVFAGRNVTISVLKRLKWFAAALLSLDVCCTVCVEMTAPYLLFAQGFSPFALFQSRKLSSAVIWASYPVLNNILGFCRTAAHTQVHIYSEEYTGSICRNEDTDSKAERVSMCVLSLLRQLKILGTEGQNSV